MMDEKGWSTNKRTSIKRQMERIDTLMENTLAKECTIDKGNSTRKEKPEPYHAHSQGHEDIGGELLRRK